MGSSVIPKSSTPERIAQNRQLDFVISEEDMGQLKALDCGVRSCDGTIFMNDKTSEEFWGKEY
jgi:diketogulonate reductase-like aldo/keto reductase